MAVCEHCPGQRGIPCSQSKSVREMKYTYGLSPQEITETVCENSTDERRLEVCPGFYDILDNGQRSEYAVKPIPDLGNRQQGNTGIWGHS